jgi:hypothetical protein
MFGKLFRRVKHVAEIAKIRVTSVDSFRELRQQMVKELLNKLESGKINQIEGALVSIDSLNTQADGYCIMGVMEAIHSRFEPDRVKLIDGGEVTAKDGTHLKDLEEGFIDLKTQDHQNAALLPVTQKRYGITKAGMNKLIQANDEGVPFKTLATALRRHPEFFFNRDAKTAVKYRNAKDGWVATEISDEEYQFYEDSGMADDLTDDEVRHLKGRGFYGVDSRFAGEEVGDAPAVA